MMIFAWYPYNLQFEITLKGICIILFPMIYQLGCLHENKSENLNPPFTSVFGSS